MSTRRRSPVKTSPLDAPHGVENAPPITPDTIKESNTNHPPRAVKSRTARARTLKLQSAAPKPMVDISLKELLQIKPVGITVDSKLEKEQAAAERVEEAKEALGKLECEIVSALFPSSGLPESLQDVAARLGMTVKEVREVADNALRGLRGTKSSRPRLSTVWN
jgi:DNA-directed RNA polymerase sigma subunit (sigma70/sigma32)